MTRSIALVRFRQERLFVLALLLALACALIPALFPAGNAMGRINGSAFDPTTSTVTLRSREQAAEPAIIEVDPGRDREQAHQAPPALLPRQPQETTRTIRFMTGPAPAPRAAPDAAPHPFAQARPRAPPAL